MTMDLRRLALPFALKDISWRLQAAGKGEQGIWAIAVAYVESRAIQERLDDVCGPAGWSIEYARQSDGQVWAGITIHTPDGPVTKWDGTGPIVESAGISSADATKGTLSVAFKRAAVAWGIGRYLYHVPPMKAHVFADRRGRFRGKLKPKDGETLFSWDPPALPAWALPGGTGQAPEPEHVNPATGEVADGTPPGQGAPPPTAPAPGHASATDSQLGLIRQLMASSAITAEERAGIQTRMDAGPSKAKASEMIEWLKTTTASRKKTDEKKDQEIPW